MSKTPEQLLALEIGGASVAEHLRRAVAAGLLIEHPDGGLEPVPKAPGISSYIAHRPGKHLDCRFLMEFLFDIAYGMSAVPHGCRECYKVIVKPADLRGLLALRALQQTVACNSKCGAEIDRPITQNCYIGFFYCVTLERARQVYWQVRAAVDAETRLGPATPMRIKRGCTEYEIHCGPSDQYTFHQDLPELEAYLLSRYRRPAKLARDRLRERLNTMSVWVQTAYRIGDDTYLDCTGGKPLYPPSASFDPGEPTT